MGMGPGYMGLARARWPEHMGPWHVGLEPMGPVGLGPMDGQGLFGAEDGTALAPPFANQGRRCIRGMLKASLYRTAGFGNT